MKTPALSAPRCQVDSSKARSNLDDLRRAKCRILPDCLCRRGRGIQINWISARIRNNARLAVLIIKWLMHMTMYPQINLVEQIPKIAEKTRVNRMAQITRVNRIWRNGSVDCGDCLAAKRLSQLAGKPVNRPLVFGERVFRTESLGISQPD